MVLAFRHYAEDANREVDRWEWNFKQLPAHHRALLQVGASGGRTAAHGTRTTWPSHSLPREISSPSELLRSRHRQGASEHASVLSSTVAAAPESQESQLAKYKTARQCIYNNQFFIRSMLAAFDPPEEDDEEGAGGEPAAPAMLAGANTAADQLLQQEQQAGGAQQGRAGAQARTPLGDVEKASGGRARGPGGGAVPRCPAVRERWIPAGCAAAGSSRDGCVVRAVRCGRQVRYVLKNLTRDWSEEGRAEREASYARIVRELQRLFQGW